MTNNIKYMLIDELNDNKNLSTNVEVDNECEYFIETFDINQSITFNECDVKIHFNPYLRTIEYFLTNNNGKVIKKIKNNLISSDLEFEFIKEIENFVNCKNKSNNFTIGVSGTKYDIEDFTALVQEYNKKEKKFLNIIQGKIIESIDRINDLKNVRISMANSGINNLNNKKLLNAIDECINEKNQLVVCATMSTGKSSLINSFLSYNLMPSKNEACTAKIFRVKADNSLKNFVDNKGRVINEEILNKLNDDYSISNDIFIKGPIKNFSDIDNFEIIDTPGPNNSLNSDHKTVTYDFIKSDIKPLTIFLLDATKLLTTDEDDFLGVIAQERKNKSKINKDRFIFVINKSDALNIRGKDSLENIKENVLKKLHQYEIENPKIHFISARNSLLARMSIQGILLDSYDEDDLDIAIRRAKRGDSIFYQMSDVSNGVKKEVDRAIKNAIDTKDELGLVIATSGILGLELTIKEFMGKYKKFRIVNKVYNLCSRAIENESILEELNDKIIKNKQKSNALNNAILNMKSKVGNPEKMHDFIKEIQKIKFGDTLTPIEKTINKEFDEFRIKINKLPVTEANGKKLVNLRLAEKYATDLQNKYTHLKANLQSEFTASISRDVVNTIDNIMNKYTKYLSDVFQDIKITGDADIKKYFKNVGEDYLTLIKSSKINEMVTETYKVRNPAKKGIIKSIVFFWRDDYITEHKEKCIEGVELDKIKEILTSVREDLYELYKTIQDERKKTENKCINELTIQVKAATEIVLKEMDKISKLTVKQKKLNENIESYASELNNKREIIDNVKNQVKRLVKIS